MIKFPKTPRLLPSPPSEWRRLTVVVEEKLDGANAGISVEDGVLKLQSRGHILSGGHRERQFARFKQWAYSHENELRERIGPNQVVFGEWLYAKHRAYYDALPAYFVAYDVFDRERDLFLTSAARNALVSGLMPVAPELHRGKFGSVHNFSSFIGPSKFKTTKWREAFSCECVRNGLDARALLLETDNSDQMEGVYIRIESETQVVGRMKVHRPGFEKVRTDDEQWLRRPIVVNGLTR